MTNDEFNEKGIRAIWENNRKLIEATEGMIINSVIRKTKIKADGGNLSVSLCLYFGNNSYKEYCAIPQKIEHFMRQIMRIADAEQWEDLPGKHIRLRILSAENSTGFSEMGHIVEDDWVNLREAVECS